MLSQFEFKVTTPANISLEESLHEWLRQALFFIGGSWYTNRGEIKTLREVSSKLKLRWLINYNVAKIVIEQHERKTNWLSGYSIGNLDPFVFDGFWRGYCVTVAETEAIERIIKTYLPNIEIVQCSFCGNRFGNTLIGDGWFCDACEVDFSRRRSRAGFVYVFGSIKNGLYKIGCSNTPQDRMRDYQLSKLPFSVEMLHTIPVDDKAKAEAELHRLYRKKRTNGEWFNLSQDDLSRIKGLKKYVAGRWLT